MAYCSYQVRYSLLFIRNYKAVHKKRIKINDLYGIYRLSDQDIATRAAITLKTANVTGQSTDAVSQELTSVWNGYKVSAEEAQLYIDRLAAVAATTASNLEQLSTGMSKVASAAAAMGVGQDQLAAQLSTIISVTRQAPESVGTALRTVYARISDIKAGIDEDGVDLGRYSGKMAELGFNVLDVSGHLRDMGQVMEEIGGKWQTLTREQQISLAQTMAGQRQYSNLIALFDNFDKYTQALHTAQNAAGTLQKQQDTYMQGTKAHLNQLKAATQNLYDSLVNADSIEPLIDALTGAVNLAAKFVDALGGGGTILLSLGGIAANVFSNQLTQGMETFIHNFTLGHSQVKQMNASLEIFDNLLNNSNLDSSTHTMIQNFKATEQKLAKTATPGEFKQMNQILQDTTVNVNKYNIALEQRTNLQNNFSKLQKVMKENYKDIQSLSEIENTTIDELDKRLDKMHSGYEQVSNSMVTFSQNLKNQENSSMSSSEKLGMLKDQLTEIQNSLKQGGFTEASQQVQIFLDQINSMSEVAPDDEGFKEFSDKVKQHFLQLERTTNTTFQGIREEVENLNNTMNSSTNAIKNNQKQLDKIGFEERIRGVGKLAGSFTQLTATANQGATAIAQFGKGNIGSGILGLVSSVGMLTSGIASATTAMEIFGVTSKTALGLIGAAIAAVEVIIISVMSAINAAQEKLKKIIEDNNKEIEKLNKQQDQIQKNKELYDSLEELSKKYEQGLITRSDLKAEIENLIDKYGLQGEIVDKLRKKYENLTEAILESRQQDAQSFQENALKKKTLAEENLVASNNGKHDLKIKNSYVPQYSSNVQKLIEQAGGEVKVSGNGWSNNISFNIDENDPNAIRTQYKKFQNLINIIKINYKKQLEDENSGFSQFIDSISQWMQNHVEYIQDIETQEKDFTSAISSNIGLKLVQNGQLDFKNINNINDYSTQKNILKNAIQEQLKRTGQSGDAEKIAENFIHQYYRDTFLKFNEGNNYIKQLEDKLVANNSSRLNPKILEENKKQIQSVIDKISKLDQLSLEYMQKNFDIEDISNWKQLDQIVEYLSDPQTNERLIQLGEEAQGIFISDAQSQYNLYSSLADQLNSSKKKTISKKTFKGLTEQVQQFFSITAKGQYKLTGDAQEFYETVNKLSLQGFTNNIDEIVKRQTFLGEVSFLNKDNFTDSLLTDLVSSSQNYASSKVFDVLAMNGYNQQIPALIAGLNQGDLQSKQKAYAEISEILDAIAKTDFTNFSDQINNLNTELAVNAYGLFSAAENSQELKKFYEEQKTKMQQFGSSLQEQNILTQAYTKAMLDLDQSLKIENFDSKQIEDYAKHLQKIAKSSDIIADELAEDADAAEKTAIAYLNLNNGYEKLNKNWKTWSSFLSSDSSSAEFLQGLNGVQEALSQMLNIDEASISQEFVTKYKNIIAAAANGSTQAILQLKDNLRVQLFTGLLEGINEELVPKAQEAFNLLQANIPQLEMGQIKDEKFLQSIGQLYAILGPQAKKILDLFNIDTQLEMETVNVKDTQQIPSKETTYETFGDGLKYPVTDVDGNQYTTDYPFIREMTRQSLTPVEIEKTVTVPKMNDGKFIIKHARKTVDNKLNGANYSALNPGEKKGKTKSSKSTPSQKNTKDLIKEQVDRYHDINISLKQINKQLEKQQKLQDKLYGSAAIRNLQKQNETLEQQKKLLQQKQKIQQTELSEMYVKLSEQGVTFNGNFISNYTDILTPKLNAWKNAREQQNKLILQYNEAIATSNEQLQKTLEKQINNAANNTSKLEKIYKEQLENISKYEKLLDDKYENQLKQEDIQYKKIDNNITQFRAKLEQQLDFGDYQRAWNQFNRNVLDADSILTTSSFDAINKDANLALDQLSAYFDTSYGSLVGLTQQLNETRKEIQKIDETGQSAIYGNDKKRVMKDLQNDLQKLISQLGEIEDLEKQIDQAYLDTIDDISDQFGKQITDYEFVSGLLQHDMDLLTLLYGDKNYDAMEKYYNSLHANQLDQIDSLKKQRDFWKQQWDEAVAKGQSNAAQKFKQNYMQAVNDLNSAITDSVQTLQDKYTNAINKIFDTLDKRMSGGRGTDYLQMEWNLINKNADEYLDTINAAFAIQELETKYRKVIDETDNVKAQKTLTDLMDQQLSNLKAKDKLTQYDVDRAEKLLKIEQARLALEDSRNNKTSLRLKRDSQGNYSYVYSADENAVNKAAEELAKAQNDLYNFDKQAYKDNLNNILSAWKDFQSEYKDIIQDTSLSEEERVERLALLREQYGEYINNKIAENTVIRQNLADSAFADYAALYNGDYQAYVAMLDNEKNHLLSEFIPYWDSGIQHMTDTFVAEGGFIPSCQQAFNELDQITREYQNQLDTLQQVADRDFNELKLGIDDTASHFQQLIISNDALITSMTNEMITINNLKTKLSELKDSYDEVYFAALAAAQAGNNFITGQNKKSIDETPSAGDVVGQLSGPSATGANSAWEANPNLKKNNLFDSMIDNLDGKSEVLKDMNQIIDGIAGAIHNFGSYGNNPFRKDLILEIFGQQLGEQIYSGVLGIINPFYAAVKSGSGVTANDYLSHGLDKEYYSQFTWEELKKKYGGMSFDTGGYTGVWGAEGRLAMLHQKELVLNASDTKNLLNAVSVMRNILSAVGNNIFDKLSNLTAKFNGNTSNNSEQIEQNVHISATFPNVNSKQEIEEAFNDLVNLAAQRALRRT